MQTVFKINSVCKKSSAVYSKYEEKNSKAAKTNFNLIYIFILETFGLIFLTICNLLHFI